MGSSDSKFESMTQLGSRGNEQNLNMNSLPYCSISQIKNTLLKDEAFMSGQITEQHHFKVTAEIL
jgi:hypothetical protein